MVTRTEERLAGPAATVTAGALTTGLVLFRGGPPTAHPGAVRTWLVEHATTVRFSALVWLAAAIALVIFAVAVREAIWATVIDRHWAAVLFVQGAWGSPLYAFAGWLVLAG